MSRYAYLVAHVNTAVVPPKIVRVAIYGDSAKNIARAISKGNFAFDIQVASGSDFEKAKRNLLNMLSTEIGRLAYGWAIDMLPPEEKT